ncbi:uncharacterized protein K460DRAFT_285040 [Cucurbitaria berberidis CBS 394.84]|uniref:Uncharacterized protein n=1 Tax=Cucurbitaria berberidis CBS 394.84 TaxID=1168544 RepID=A0A9P4GEZ1_9PLEO|nr:uncharacterized protein K460DRAFT_285040 [Cucurbitaria berberidis CBS 394.84]KAF1844803.1 hypothetical protein K460DRAFT_285040 [Cucurbitaria berberidis CBS 394.84]
MTSFRSLTADLRPLQEFEARIPRVFTKERDGGNSNIPLHVFKWSEGTPNGTEISGLKSVEELETQCQGTIRVIFAPQDVPAPATGDGLVELFKKCNIPSAFVEEGLQGVSQSFAAHRDVDGTVFVWFHFLCKDIAVSNNRIVHLKTREDMENNDDKSRLEAQEQSQANFTWLKPGFVLKMRDQRGSSPMPNRTMTSSSDSTLAAPSTKALVELLCFGAPITLRDRFQELKTVATCDDLLQDPYVLLEIVFGEMYKVIDRTGWAVSDIFGAIETQTLGMASKPGKATKELLNDHFTGLHNLAKHTIFLRENCESALATLDGLKEHHKGVVGDLSSPSQELTRQALKYRKTLYQSTQRRLTSLDARMANIIQLSFHIVTQGDSRLMQSENQSMKTIAVMTLLFMPLSTVATIFGTQFMKVQDEAPFHITVSQDFWLLWLIAVPLTGIVMIVWRVWYMDARGRLVDDIPQGKPGFMGWKTLKQTLRRQNETQNGHHKVTARKAPDV